MTDISATQVRVDPHYEILPSQRAKDPTADNIPACIDFTIVESSLDGETLTAVFHLRRIPEELDLNRKGTDNISIEYMWLIYIDADGENEDGFERYEYTFAAISNIDLSLTGTPVTSLPFEEVVQVILWRHQPDNHKKSMLDDGSQFCRSAAQNLASFTLLN